MRRWVREMLDERPLASPLSRPRRPMSEPPSLVELLGTPGACLCIAKLAICETLVDTEEYRSDSSKPASCGLSYAKLHRHTGHRPSAQYGIRHSTRKAWSQRRGLTRRAPGGITRPDAQQASNLSFE